MSSNGASSSRRQSDVVLQTTLLDSKKYERKGKQWKDLTDGLVYRVVKDSLTFLLLKSRDLGDF